MSFLLYSAVIFLACTFQGITGFGMALVTVPIALFFLDQVTIVVSLLVSSIFLNTFLTSRIKKPVDYRLLFPMWGGALLGLPMGIWLLTHLSPAWLKIFAGTSSVFFTFLIAKDWIKLPRARWLGGVIGWLSGMLQTSIGMSGPPVVLYMASHLFDKSLFRKQIVTYFLVMILIALGMIVFSGTPIQSGLLYGVIVLPAALLGGWVGDRLAIRIPQKAFRRLMLIGIALTGMYTIYSGLMG